MAYNQGNFWDWVRAFDSGNNHGEGVDRPNYPPPPPPPPFPFGDPTPLQHGPHPPPPPPPHHGPGSLPPHHHHPPAPHNEFGGFPFCGPDFFSGHRGFHAGPGHRGGRRGRCNGRRPSRGHEEGENHQGPGAFDLNGLLASLASHPLAQAYRNYFEQFAQRSGEGNRGGDEDEENTFTPPIDIFSTETHYVLHVALPGAKKEDVGINWDTEKGVLNIAGVIYRQGDEEFLKTLTQTERKVGVFERSVKLPPPGNSEEKDEVDGDAITAKLEDGVLVISVPKIEKEWTDVKKVDIQ